VNIITNWQDQKGLWRHGCLLESLLQGWGHEVRRVQYTVPSEAHPADLNIFIETIRPDLFPFAPRQWLCPMPEWFTAADAEHLPTLERVLCATREAERLFAPLTDKAIFTGWESEDRYDPAVPRENRVLHVAGGSILKGTQAVLDAWEQWKLPYPLTVVGDEQVVKPRQIQNVTYRLGRLPDDELKRLQNSHRVHLQPSETEGWGHTIHEGLSVGADVYSTIEAPGVRHVPGSDFSFRNLAPLTLVDPLEIAELFAFFEWPPGSDDSPRDHFLRDREQFRERLKALL
jgi:hypothetical protein